MHRSGHESLLSHKATREDRHADYEKMKECRTIESWSSSTLRSRDVRTYIEGFRRQRYGLMGDP